MIDDEEGWEKSQMVVVGLYQCTIYVTSTGERCLLSVMSRLATKHKVFESILVGEGLARVPELYFFLSISRDIWEGRGRGRDEPMQTGHSFKSSRVLLCLQIILTN